MNSYAIFKACHIIAMVAWMAGLFYLPRLFVYHSEAQNPDTQKTLEIMESKLLKIIMMPAHILTYVFAIILLILNPELLKQPWLHIKITLVLCLSGFHAYLSLCHKKFSRGENNKSSRFYRLINEIPTLILILVVFLVVLK